jgi:hypothetical protein
MKTAILLVGFSALGYFIGYYTALPEEPTQTQTRIQTDPKQQRDSHNSIANSNEDLSQAQADVVQKLNKELSLAKSEIKDLENLNVRLAEQIKHMELPISPSVDYPELVTKIDNLPLPLVNEQIGKLFDEYALQQVNDTRAFAKRLLEVALKDQEENSMEIDISFSTSTLAGVRPLGDRASVAKSDSIFGHISASGRLNENVVVKWQNLGTGEILSLTNQSLNTNGREQYIWARPKKGWQVGRYKASIYSMDDHVTPLGSGLFTIVAISDAQTDRSSDDKVLQELINSGQAVPKQTR